MKGLIGLFFSFIDQVFQVNGHMTWHKDNKKFKNMKQDHECDALGKKFNLSTNFIPLRKSNKEGDIDGLILKHHLDFLIPKANYGRMEPADLNIFDKLFLHTKTEETDTWLKYYACDKISYKKSQIIIYHRSRSGVTPSSSPYIQKQHSSSLASLA